MSTDPLDALDRTFEVATRLTDVMERDLGRRGLNLTQASALFHLRDRGPLVQRQLSDAIGHSPRHVTSVVDALEQAGLVRREQHPDDRRAWLVTLTERGTAQADAMRQGRQEAAEGLFAGVRAADRAAYVAVLEHVLGRLTGVAQDAGGQDAGGQDAGSSGP